MAVTTIDSVLYKLPADEFLKNRREFYGLKRENGESSKQWLIQVRNSINSFDFSNAEYLLIDKFVCELNKDDTQQTFK